MNIKSMLMLSFLTSLFSCKKDNTPIFPQTDNAEIKVSKLTIPANQNVVKHIISKDKMQIYIYTFENEDDNTHYPMVGNHLLIYDELGKFEKDVPLLINSNSGHYDMYFTDAGELVLRSPSNIYFIDAETFTQKNFYSWSYMSYPFRDINYKKAEAETKAWETDEIKKLNAVYQLKNDEIKVENKKIPTEYWAKYRKVKDNTPMMIEDKVKEFYGQFAQEHLSKNGTTLEGLKVNTDNEMVLTSYQDTLVYLNVKGLDLPKVNWKSWRTNTKFRNEGFEAQDGNAILTYLNKERTSSIKDDFTGKTANDFTMKVQIGTKTGTFKVKDRRLYLAQDGFFATQNGAVVVSYKNEIYLIQ